MGVSAGIPLWLLILSMGQVKAHFAELVVSSDDQYMYHQLRGFVGISSFADNTDFIAANSRKIISKGINFDKVCSYWNDFHYKTFNDEVFFFPGTCTYIFASHCKENYEDFVIQIRHIMVNNSVSDSKITLRIDAMIVELVNGTVLVNGDLVEPPYSETTAMIQRIGLYTKITSTLGLVFVKNDDGSFELQLDGKYANHTCGLCGDLIEESILNQNGIILTETEFGNLKKVEGPNEDCADPEPPEWSGCPLKNASICEAILTSPSFSSCNEIISVEPYIDACEQDLCQCQKVDYTSCICSTVAEYSHQCILHRGEPENWRDLDFCPKPCPSNMHYKECGSPCSDSCSDPERGVLCDKHCVEGCYCPEGQIFDDVGNNQCIPMEECPCSFNGNIYAPGETYSTSCKNCSCYSGKWNCTVIPCSRTCAIEGGSYITTFDQLRYTVYGDCTYVISKLCETNSFIVLGDLTRCGIRETDACLTRVTIMLNDIQTVLEIRPGGVYVNKIFTNLPAYSEDYVIFEPSSPFIIVNTFNPRLQAVIQIKPVMQLYLVLGPSFKNLTCGLCGNFNSMQTDDFMAISGVVEGTAAAFVNTWKTSAFCSSIQNNFDNPCTLSVENEQYAKYWCELILDPTGVFSPCHNTVDPNIYYKNCMMDTCSCEKSEDCMCAAIFSYVKICAAKGIIVENWQTKACSNFLPVCPNNQIFSYTISSCQPTCRSLSEPDIICKIHFDPLPGCTCKKGFYLNDIGKCILASACPCYHRGVAIPADKTITDNGILCTCIKGKLSCLVSTEKDCKYPMIFVNCNNSKGGATGIECAKSCQTLDMYCYANRCVPGCVCPPGSVSDDRGGCVPEEKCPCVHNEAMYDPGEEIQIRCNTCVCKTRKWQCTTNTCLATCTVYGDGHYITFDKKRYIFNGECQYSLVQDHCSLNDSSSTFRIITENIPCGTTGTTCSKSIKVVLENYELILVDDHLNVVQRGLGRIVPYRVRLMGIYLVIEANNGLLLLWDKKTSIFIKVTSAFKGKLCGLCGNYDGNGNNDFTTRNNAVVANIEEFGNSWKLSPTCPDAKVNRNPCSLNPYRLSWAQKQCNIISSNVFSDCHPHVDPSKYYDDCVTDSCACNTGGDCECFCTAVAAYAQACGEFRKCISWRSPNICPLFCDYYNDKEGCEWHYRACGAPCLKTCRNPSGKCRFEIRGLEGCYPKCPKEKPYFDEDEMKCVAICGCYDEDRKHYMLGAIVPSGQNCTVCNCTTDGIECMYHVEDCICEYEGQVYKYNQTIYNTTDGIGGCITFICKENGTIYKDIHQCPSTTAATFTTVLKTSTSTFTTTRLSTKTILTSAPTTITTRIATSQTTSPSTVCKPVCKWTLWISTHQVTFGHDGGDTESYELMIEAGYIICKKPTEIGCRAQDYPKRNITELGQNIVCTVSTGLVCYNKDQVTNSGRCYNYEIRFFCCENYCITTPPTTTIATRVPETTTSFSISASQTTPNRTIYPVTCTPRCVQTSWFDESTPLAENTGIDIENTELIKKSGKEICDQPIYVECRAKDFPNLSIETLGQNVTCNLTTGFICYNSAQASGRCYNYEIRYVCCDDLKHCETQPTTKESTTSTKSTTSTGPPSSTQCHCYANGSVFLPYDTIYKTMDSFGCYVYGVCTENCEIEQYKGPCPKSTTTIPSSTTTSATTPTATTTITTIKTTKTPSTTHSTTSSSTTSKTTTKPTPPSTTATSSSTTASPTTTRTVRTTPTTPQKTTTPLTTHSTTSSSTTPHTTTKSTPQSATISSTTTSPTTNQTATTTATTPKTTTTPSTTHSATSSSTSPKTTTKLTPPSTTATTSSTTTSLTTTRTATTTITTIKTTKTPSTTHSTTSSTTSKTTTKPTPPSTTATSSSTTASPTTTRTVRTTVTTPQKTTPSTTHSITSSSTTPHTTTKSTPSSTTATTSSTPTSPTTTRTTATTVTTPKTTTTPSTTLSTTSSSTFSKTTTKSTPPSTTEKTISTTASPTTSRTVTTTVTTPQKTTTPSTTHSTTSSSTTPHTTTKSTPPSTTARTSSTTTSPTTTRTATTTVTTPKTTTTPSTTRTTTSSSTFSKTTTKSTPPSTTEKTISTTASPTTSRTVTTTVTTPQKTTTPSTTHSTTSSSTTTPHTITKSTPPSTTATTPSTPTSPTTTRTTATTVTTPKTTTTPSTTLSTTSSSTFSKTTTKSTPPSTTEKTISTTASPTTSRTVTTTVTTPQKTTTPSTTHSTTSSSTTPHTTTKSTPPSTTARTSSTTTSPTTTRTATTTVTTPKTTTTPSTTRTTTSSSTFSKTTTKSTPPSTTEKTISTTASPTTSGTVTTTVTTPQKTTTPSTTHSTTSSSTTTPHTITKSTPPSTTATTPSTPTSPTTTRTTATTVTTPKTTTTPSTTLSTTSSSTFSKTTSKSTPPSTTEKTISTTTSPTTSRTVTTTVTTPQKTTTPSTTHSTTSSSTTPHTTTKSTPPSTKATTSSTTTSPTTNRTATTTVTTPKTTTTPSTTHSATSSSTSSKTTTKSTPPYTTAKTSSTTTSPTTTRTATTTITTPKTTTTISTTRSSTTSSSTSPQTITKSTPPSTTEKTISTTASPTTSRTVTTTVTTPKTTTTPSTTLSTTSSSTFSKTTSKSTPPSTTEKTISTTASPTTSRTVTTTVTTPQKTTTPSTTHSTTSSSTTPHTTTKSTPPSTKATTSSTTTSPTTNRTATTTVTTPKTTTTPSTTHSATSSSTSSKTTTKSTPPYTTAKTSSTTTSPTTTRTATTTITTPKTTSTISTTRSSTTSSSTSPQTTTKSTPPSTTATTSSTTASPTTTRTTTITVTTPKRTTTASTTHSTTSSSTPPSTPPATTSSTTASPTTTLTTPNTTTTALTSQFTTMEGCPPRKVNEKWLIGNCTEATCHGNNVVTFESVKCPNITIQSCTSGVEPRHIYSSDGCCYKTVCDCVCSGWSGQQFITFDGTSYKYQDTCTNILVQEIIEDYGDFKVLIDNTNCSTIDSGSCQISIVVYYKNHVVRLTNSVGKNEVIFNSDSVYPGYNEDGIFTYNSNLKVVVSIPTIEAYISLSGTVFYIKLPFTLFKNNTEGQCGTCSNTKADDCRLPDGSFTSDCSVMASFWNFEIGSKPSCNVITPTPVTARTEMEFTAYCPSTSVCYVIQSEIFADCHKVVPPSTALQLCFANLGNKCDVLTACEGVKAYAEKCLIEGLCINWQPSTQCSYICPPTKVFDPCASLLEPTCSSGVTHMLIGESCVCPNGTTRFNAINNVCVPVCACVGPDGNPKMPGEYWNSNCQNCTCEPHSKAVQCLPIGCPMSVIPDCSNKDGSVLVEVIDPENTCCLKNECRCNASYCLPAIPHCLIGFILSYTLNEGDCCPTYECVSMDVCVVNTTIYQPGTIIPPPYDDPCHVCNCTDSNDPQTQLKLVECTTTNCEGVCKEGFENKTESGICCYCDQVACTMSLDNETVIIIKDNSTFQPPDDKCSYYGCHKKNGQFVLTQKQISCTISSQKDCSVGYNYTKPDGECCGFCNQTVCVIQIDNTTNTMQNGEIWTLLPDFCVIYECIQTNGMLEVILKEYVCPNKTCPVGYVYRDVNEQCCGECVKVNCTLEMPDKTIKTFQYGESWSPPNDTCIVYTCMHNLELMTIEQNCQPFDPSKCQQGTISTDKTGCCLFCIETVYKICNIFNMSKTIESNNCTSSKPVEITSCKGGCDSSYEYSLISHQMEEKCECCKPTQTSIKEVELTCKDGKTSTYKYTYIEKCACSIPKCENITTKTTVAVP